jgi:hypothetical protein
MLALVLLAPWVGGHIGTSPVAVLGASEVSGAPPGLAIDAALSPWDGSINVYRTGVFTTQKTWYYCTAADVQIIRNIVRHVESHSRAAQDRYFAYMRNHMRYDIPVKHGVDPAGWTAGMRHFIDDRYRLVRSATFGSLLRSAVRSLRRTNLPVALFVDHGNHGWVLHGFTATADPAVTSDFTVTSVRVTGPLWGRQNATYGYDMKPNKKLTRNQLRDFVTRWHYPPIRMVWEGEFLSIQPIGSTSTAGVSPSANPSPTPAPNPRPTSTIATAPPAAPSQVPVATETAEPAPTTQSAPAGVVGRGPPGAGDRQAVATGLLIVLTGAVTVAAVALRRRQPHRQT